VLHASGKGISIMPCCLLSVELDKLCSAPLPPPCYVPQRGEPCVKQRAPPCNAFLAVLFRMLMLAHKIARLATSKIFYARIVLADIQYRVKSRRTWKAKSSMSKASAARGPWTKACATIYPVGPRWVAREKSNHRFTGVTRQRCLVCI